MKKTRLPLRTPLPTLKKFRLVIEYDGAEFAGWQFQPGARTVQGVLEQGLKKLLGAASGDIRVNGASRTDSGTHALGQVAVFEAKTSMKAVNFLRALPSVLPEDVSVRSVTQCPRSFDPREDAKGKTYRYTILNQSIPSVFERRTAYFVRSPLDIAAMRRAAGYLRGKKDFVSFETAAHDGSRRNFTHTRLTRVTVAREPGNRIVIEISGKNFLYKMCRTIAGTLVAVGRGKMRPEQVKEILKGKDRSLAGPTAPAHGLCLVKIFY